MSVRPLPCVWHGALTRAAEEGGAELLAAALAAEEYVEGRARYVGIVTAKGRPCTLWPAAPTAPTRQRCLAAPSLPSPTLASSPTRCGTVMRRLWRAWLRQKASHLMLWQW